MRRLLRDNGLSIVLLGIFLLTVTGHAVTGWRHYNHEQADHGESPVTLVGYVASADFAESVAENWESEFLQMAMFVILTVFLYQKGSPESKDPEESDPVDEDPLAKRPPADAPKPVRVGGWRLRLYQHSLSLALIALFLASFALHAWSSQRLHNQERADHGDPPVTLGQHLARSQFWYESFQNWQSEFLSVGVLVLLSVWLRERGSAQSKPVAAPHRSNE
jgi:hypothetical protein